MSDRDAKPRFSKAAPAASSPFNTKTLILPAATFALFAATVLTPQLLTSDIIISPLITLKLPVLTAATFLVAVIFTREGTLTFKGRKLEFSSKGLREKNLSDRKADTFSNEDTEVTIIREPEKEG